MRHPIDGTRRNLLILEFSAGGHHPTYIRRLLESDLPNSARIILASRKELFVHPEIRPFADKFTAHELDISPALEMLQKDFSASGLMYSSWKIGELYRRTYRALASTMRIAFVVVPFLDDCLLGLAIPRESFSGTPWLGITMRTMHHFNQLGIVAPRQRLARVRKYLFERILNQKSTAAILTIDPTLAKFARQQIDPRYKTLEYLPDPAAFHANLPSKAHARAQLAIPDDARVILLYGEISARKGVIELLESAADPACSERLHVLLAGRLQDNTLFLHNAPYQSLLERRRVHRVEGFLDDDGERTILAAADCMWVGYTDFYLMSGVMVLSGRHGIPVISSTTGLIGYWTREQGIGICVDLKSRASIVSALNRIVEEPDVLAQMGGKGISVFAKHDPSELQRLVTDKFLQSNSAEPN